jgi:hypothetical protein
MSENNGSGCGCFTIIIVVLICWALMFGVNYQGKHYGISSCNTNGVTIE